MRTHLKTLLLSLLLSTTTITHASENYHTIEEFLAAQKTIRIASDNTPGYGNQAASASLITRLRAMGFKGKFEFVYSNQTLAKITTLFDLPMDIPDSYYDAKNNIEFIKLKEFINRHKNKKNELVELGMIGRDDDFGCGLAEEDGVDIDHGMGILDCSNEANLMDVKQWAAISPFYDEFNSITKINDDDPKLPHAEEGSNNKFFVMPVADLPQAEDYLQHDERGKALVKQKPGLITLINAMKKNDYNILPVYGYTVQMDVCVKAGDKSCFPGNIFKILTAARYAQLKGQLSFRKPLIIPVFYNYDGENKKLGELLQSDNWGQYEFSGSANARAAIKQLGLSGALSFANISDANIQEKIQTLKPGQILLLSVGALPKIVFDGMYNHVSDNTWPQIREGANSFNSLILTGKPHFRCGFDWEICFDRVTDAHLKNQLEQFYGNFCSVRDTWQTAPEVYQQLGEFFIEASDAKSALDNYFRELKVDALKAENDKIHFTLEDVIK